MKNRYISVLLAALVLVPGGCAGNKSKIHYYTLHTAEDGLESRTVKASGFERVIGLGPVNMPEYLARSQIVIRDTDTEIQLLDGHRWAEPLEDLFTRILVLSLSKLLPASRLVEYPSRSWPEVNHQLSINIHRFDAERAGIAVLQVSWTLIDRQDPRSGLSGDTALKQSYSRGDYAAMAKVMGQLVQQLALQVGQAIKDEE